MKTKNRGGRPRKHPIRVGEKVATGLRLPVALRTKLDAVVKETGGSLSQEIEARIERTFRDDEVMVFLRGLHKMLARMAYGDGERGGR